MASLVVLKLGKGNWQQGCPVVTAQLWQEEHGQGEHSMTSQLVGSLPPAPALATLYEHWRSLYRALSERLLHHPIRSIEIEAEGMTNVSRATFDTLCVQLKQAFNLWLETPSFSRLERQLRTRLSPAQSIRVIIETEDALLRRFPWHLWHFFDDYSLAEAALSVPEYERVTSPQPQSAPIRILAVLGNSNGINVQQDRGLLQQLPQTETVVLVEPDRTELNQQLWDEQGWDILFFAGHSTSQSDGSTGEIVLNPTDRLAVEQLRNALKTAISRRIKLAIFNSCDGVGLARSMADLNIPQLIVMREPVPDRMAQEFLKNFLMALTQGKPLSIAVREAREKLQGWEQEFPCASWLPVLCQNPAEALVEWQAFAPESVAPKKSHPPPDPTSTQPALHSPRHRLKIAGITSLGISSLLMGIRFLGVLQAVELVAFDHLMRLRPLESIDPRIVVVEVSEQDIQQYGYPLEDATLTMLIDKLESYQPSAIGLDMHRTQPRGQGRSAFIQQFQQNSNLLIICSFGAADHHAPPPEFSADQQIRQVGFSDLIVEGTRLRGTLRDDLLTAQAGGDGDIVRRQLLSYDPTLAATPSPCTTPYSFSLQLAAQFFSQTQVQPITVNADQNWQIGTVAFPRLPTRFAGYQQLDGLTSQIVINYRTAPPGARITLDQVMQEQVDRNLIENRIVLVGTTALSAKDYFDTLYGEMPGVWIHAHMLSQMLSAVIDDRPLIWALPQGDGFQWGDWLWVLGWSAVGGVVAWQWRSGLWIGTINIVFSIALHQLCLVLLIQGGWMPFIPALLGLWTTSFVSHAVITSAVRRQG